MGAAATAPPLSYELKLFRVMPGERPQISGRNNPTDYDTRPPDPQKEALKQRVVVALATRHPRLKVCQLPLEQIAQFEKISIDQARSKYRHLEISDPESGNGLQIVLRDDETAVMIPFWHEGQKARDTFQELWSYLGIICRETGYRIYDPQLERMFDSTTGCDAVLAQYEKIVRHLRGTGAVNEVEESASPPPQFELRPDRTPEQPRLDIRQLKLPEDRGVVLVAVQESGAACGFAEVAIGDDRPERSSVFPVAHLKGWHVEPPFRGQGIGRTLIEAAEQWAALRGARELASDVDSAPEEIPQAYLSCGFAETGRVVHLTKPIP